MYFMYATVFDQWIELPKMLTNVIWDIIDLCALSSGNVHCGRSLHEENRAQDIL